MSAGKITNYAEDFAIMHKINKLTLKIAARTLSSC